MTGYKKTIAFAQKNSALLQGILLVVAFAVLLVFMWFRMDNLLNSDISTQLVLSKFLRDEHSIISTNWFYATELHVLGYNLIFEPLFFLTSNWKIVRFLGQAELYLLLLLSVWYFCKNAGLKKYYGLIATAMIIPYSEQYFSFFLRNINYIPFLCISLISFGMMFGFARSKKKWEKALLLIMTGILALGAGLGGSRQLYITYAPVFLAVLLYLLLLWKREQTQKKRSALAFLMIAADGLALNLVGYIINNSLLASLYDFKNYDKIEWSGFQLDEFIEIIKGMFQNLGMPYGMVFSFAAVHSCVCFILVFVSVFAIVRIIKRWGEVSFETAMLALLILSAASISLLLYCFTTQRYVARYDQFWVVLLYPLLALYHTENHMERSIANAILVVLIAGIGICAVDSYGTYARVETTGDLKAVVNYLVKNGYENGYATFWQSNIVTELSNGTIDMWDWGGGGGVVTGRELYHGHSFDGGGDFTCVDKLYWWAQDKAHVYTHPTGKVFWLLREDQAEKYTLCKRLNEDFVVYRSPDDLNQGTFDEEEKLIRYVVYGFNSYDEMYSLIGEYTFTDRKTIKPHRSVKSNTGVTLYPDTYMMVCTGDNLKKCKAKLKYKQTVRHENAYVVAENQTTLEATNLERDKDYMVVLFKADEVLTDFVAEFTNTSMEDATITSIRISKTNGYYVDFYRNENCSNALDQHGTRTLYAGGSSFGPYITLVPGTYDVTCKGNGLDLLTFDCVYEPKDSKPSDDPNQIRIIDAVQTEGEIRYTIRVKHVLPKVECRFNNPSGKEVTMTALTITRTGSAD